jgi:hypothetical protein
MRAVDAALTSVGLEAFCAHAGADKADVSRGRSGRRKWQQAWTDALLDMPSLDLRHKVAICDAIAARAGLTASMRPRKSVLDVAQQAIAELRRFGEHGAAGADTLEGELLAAVTEGRFR